LLAYEGIRGPLFPNQNKRFWNSGILALEVNGRDAKLLVVEEEDNQVGAERMLWE
jgi:hypothetical protein